jgi:hypothetical protein
MDDTRQTHKHLALMGFPLVDRFSNQNTTLRSGSITHSLHKAMYGYSKGWYVLCVLEAKLDT